MPVQRQSVVKPELKTEVVCKLPVDQKDILDRCLRTRFQNKAQILTLPEAKKAGLPIPKALNLKVKV